MADLEKLVDEISNLTLLEAAQLKEMLEERLGVQAAAPMAAMSMMAAGAASGEAAEEKTEFDVTLASIGPKKIQVIKAIRALTNLGLQEAKALVEAAPSPVLQGVPKEVAEDAKAKLEAEGAGVTIA
jgi:large subunit ribosomal protein L7/L12